MSEFLSQICTAVVQGSAAVYAHQHNSINVGGWSMHWKPLTQASGESIGWEVTIQDAGPLGKPPVLWLALPHSELEALRGPIRGAIDEVITFSDVGELTLQGDLKLSAKKVKGGSGPLWFSLKGSAGQALRFGAEKGCALLAVLHMLIELVAN